MSVLVTGASGYIGSHVCLTLLEAGYTVIGLDSLHNSSLLSLDRIAQASGGKHRLRSNHVVDIRDRQAIRDLFRAERDIVAVLHLAGLKSVPESTKRPLDYWEVNVGGAVNLLTVMREFGCHTMVFSSSASVYGGWTGEQFPPEGLSEELDTHPTHPYGRTKRAVEEILEELWLSEQQPGQGPAAASGASSSSSTHQWRFLSLRYFNPVGAHPSGLLGENPLGVPGNLMPYLSQVAVGRYPVLRVFGSDYPTPDGTCIRDYIHILDLARGHLLALQRCIGDRLGRAVGPQQPKQSAAAEAGPDAGASVLPPALCRIYNLGTGRGVSVLEMVHAFEAACGKKIPIEMAGRRAGDCAILVASVRRVCYK